MTLKGNHYGSRMSAAVLSGAGLGQFVASTPDEYKKIVVDQTADLAAFRDKRSDWRSILKSSPLGDAADLMVKLEDAFMKMYDKG